VKALVVINPKSGGGKGAIVGGKVRKHFVESKEQVTFIEAASLAETLLQVQQASSSQNFDCLICVGGDGLVHDLLPAVIEHSLPLLVIPAGTGNDFARTLGLHGKRISKLLKLAETGTSSSIDLALISHSGFETPFVQILSTGFDSVVNERANNFKRVKGKVKYILAVLQKVWRFRATEFEITVDGATQKRRAMLVCIANGQSYGGGMQIVPHAKNSDGYLDLMIVDEVSPLRLLMVFPRVFFGTHVKHPKVHFLTGKEISINAAGAAFADGERIADLPVRVRLSEKSLQVFRL
jgi:diacylglycerol kinase (ATP)